MSIELSRDAMKVLRASVKRYVSENLDQEIGDLKADLLLDYVLREIGPSIYNQAITDARSYFQDRVADLEGACYKEEFSYWPTTARQARSGHSQSGS